MNVSAIIVTRGNVYMAPIYDSFPPEWEIIVWDNSHGGQVVRWAHRNAPMEMVILKTAGDLSVYGRYAAIEHASHDLIYVQDDDVIVSDPQAIVDEWKRVLLEREPAETGQQDYDLDSHLVANMPREFRHDGYTDSCLVGFGACFHRDLPARAFERFNAFDLAPLGLTDTADEFLAWYRRTCDVVFTTLTPRVPVDVPKTDREFASDDDRMWRQPGHSGERTRMLELARMVRDA